MSGKFRYVFLVLLGLTAAVYSAKVRHEKHIAYLMVDSSGDTAEVMKLTPDGIDSFQYRDSIQFQSDTGKFDTFSWVSPLQQMKLEVGYDTAITYQCSIDLGTNAYGFNYDPSDNDDSTVAVLIDTLVYLFNNTAGMKDTVVAQDSVSYIKLVSKFAQIELDGDARWTVGLPGDSLDTTSIWVTSVADVCDSMVAYVNAMDSAHYWTAYDSTTFYIIQSDDAGLDIFAIMIDTSQDSSHTQLNVTSQSSHQDTIDLISLVYDGFDIAGYQLVAILDSSTTTAQGLGLSDSGYLWLYTTRRIGYGSDSVEMFLLDSAVANSLPLRLECKVGADTTGGGVDPDTLFKERFQLVYRVTDSTSDTVMQPHCSLYVDLKLIGK